MFPGISCIYVKSSRSRFFMPGFHVHVPVFCVIVGSPSLGYSLVSHLPFCFVLFHRPWINGSFFCQAQVLFFRMSGLGSSSSLHTVCFSQIVTLTCAQAGAKNCLGGFMRLCLFVFVSQFIVLTWWFKAEYILKLNMQKWTVLTKCKKYAYFTVNLFHHVHSCG